MVKKSIKKRMQGALLGFGLLFVTGFPSYFMIFSSYPAQEETVTNIVEVFMHTPGSYSFLAIDDDGNFHGKPFPRVSYLSITIVADVHHGEMMWFHYTDGGRGWGSLPEVLTIHVRDISDVKGGGTVIR